MVSAHRSFTTRTPPEAVFAYLADFTHAEEWDPGTVECHRLDGDGGVGTRYRNVSSFLGRSTTVEYVAEELEPSTYLHFRGSNEQFTGHDRLRLEPAEGGTSVTYDADLDFSGRAKVAVPLVVAYLPFLANKTVRQLRERLDRIA
jgi:carbon monoxide dehydrogenase subunit G